jgi:hypothetical protein
VGTSSSMASICGWRSVRAFGFIRLNACLFACLWVMCLMAQWRCHDCELAIGLGAEREAPCHGLGAVAACPISGVVW